VGGKEPGIKEGEEGKNHILHCNSNRLCTMKTKGIQCIRGNSHSWSEEKQVVGSQVLQGGRERERAVPATPEGLLSKSFWAPRYTVGTTGLDIREPTEGRKSNSVAEKGKGKSGELRCIYRHWLRRHLPSKKKGKGEREQNEITEKGTFLRHRGGHLPGLTWALQPILVLCTGINRFKGGTEEKVHREGEEERFAYHPVKKDPT